ncbi:MAG: thioredoxin [Pseudobdellovibrionaceae bacterium]
MLFSSKPPSSDQNTKNDFIFDVGSADFEVRVLLASNDKPILIDFWAPWCGPCKQLGPLLEKLVTEAKGAVLMAKVNIDENPDLAQVFQVQSIPTVMAIYQGRPVTGFQGVQPESALKQLISQLATMGGDAGEMAEDQDIDAEELLKQAEEALNEGDTGLAGSLYEAILQYEPETAPAYAGLLRTLIREGNLDKAQALIDSAPEAVMKDKTYLSALSALKIAKGAPQGDLEEMRRGAEGESATPEARLTYAQALFGRGQARDSFDILMELIRTHKDWENEKARTTLVSYFDALGAGHPDTIDARKKLSRLLFS